MITDARGRIIVLITNGTGSGQIGAMETQRAGENTRRIDLGGSAIQKVPGDFRPIAIGQSVAASG